MASEVLEIEQGGNMQANWMAAREYAEKLGWKVFPVRARDTSAGLAAKSPLTLHGVKDASNDPAQIEQWAKQYPDAAIALACGDILVADLDVKGGKDGVTEWLANEGRLDGTIVARTPTGGYHVYFRNTSNRGCQKIGKAIDGRGHGGYVLLPPSKLESGEYAWVHDPETPLADPPAFVTAGNLAGLVSNGSIFAAELTQDERFAQAKKYLQKIPLAIERQSGSIRTFHAMCICFKFGLDDARARQLFDWFNANMAKPPWTDERDIRRQLDRAKNRVIADGQFGTLGKCPERWMDDRWTEWKEETTEPKAKRSLIPIDIKNMRNEEVKWVWPDKIPQGLVILIGDGKVGKGLALCEIAARVSRGAAWPDGAANDGGPGQVLWLSAEDQITKSLRPRLDAAGADFDNIIPIDPWKQLFGEETRHIQFTLDQVALIEDQIAALKNCRMIVLDPLISFLGGKINTDKMNEVCGLLNPLQEIAQRHNASCIAVIHYNKTNALNINQRIMGSVAFQSVPRAIWHVVKCPSDQDRRLFLCGAMNDVNGPMPHGMAYGFKTVNVQDVSKPISTVDWEADAIPMTAQQWLDNQGATVKPGPKTNKKSEAVRFLDEMFADKSEIPAETVEIAATLRGINKSTLHSVKTAARIESYKSGLAGQWIWRRPPANVPAASEN
ncbi:MAG TPA: bifunctional DNA primase/polymerase [Humisphaera sp.]|nr:bifunctional DNA primase/polymerase [Humisphaera sp.]